MQPANSESNEKEDVHLGVQEIVAFYLFSSQHQTDTESDIREAWQAGPDTRDEYRKLSKYLQSSLLESGCRLKISDSKQLTKKLDWLLTIPPRQAYDLDSELKRD